MRRLRSQIQARRRSAASSHTAGVLQRLGRRAIRRRAAQAAAASLLLMITSIAAASSAAKAVMRPVVPVPIQDPSGGGDDDRPTATTYPPPALSPGSLIQSSNSSLSPLGRTANASATLGTSAAATPPLLPPHLLPGPNMTSAPSSMLFDVFPGCSAHAYGLPGLPDFVVYCEDRVNGRNLSYWHEIPLNLTTDPRDNSTTMWVTVEIPKGTNAKIETQTMWPYAPMAQATIDGMAAPGSPRPMQKLRYYRAGPSLVNYGGVPQTWEASDTPDDVTGQPSDNDPLDFIEIGDAPIPVGAVVRVRLLGALALLDQNETDWKVVVLNTRDPRVAQWHDVSDVPPNTRRQLYEFFRTYKVAEGKQANRFFLGRGQSTTASAEDWSQAFFGRDDAARVVQAKNDDWHRLLSEDGGCATPRCTPMLAAARQDGSLTSATVGSRVDGGAAMGGSDSSGDRGGVHTRASRRLTHSNNGSDTAAHGSGSSGNLTTTKA